MKLLLDENKHTLRSAHKTSLWSANSFAFSKSLLSLQWFLTRCENKMSAIIHKHFLLQFGKFICPSIYSISIAFSLLDRRIPLMVLAQQCRQPSTNHLLQGHQTSTKQKHKNSITDQQNQFCETFRAPYKTYIMISYFYLARLSGVLYIKLDLLLLCK